ncbi:MAG: hypothetical protein IPH07_19675 [Deltaproteobacteria bacterium]|nr:hypothetical protein [Deltaproteobacteria bacterium]MBK8715924.1 hypothetical protein [Deltaproteobacteria bacterium]MBP7286656.1 hypothetical protein [Nannocystaceae bacterium]
MPDRRYLLVLALSLVACARETTAPADAPSEPAANLAVTPAAADADPNPGGAGEVDLEVVSLRFVARLDTELDLDDSQATALREIFTDYTAQLQPHIAYIRSKPSTVAKLQAARERRPEIRQLRAANDAAIAPVLTPDQFARYVQLRDEFREQLRERFLEGV